MRGSLPDAYLRTLAVIVFLPGRAARGLALPDRWHRCVRWAVVHVVLISLACALLANGQHFPRWLVEQVWPPSFDPPHMYSPGDAPPGRVLLWLSQSLAAWAVVVALPTAIASLLSVIVPGRHRAAKLGGVKWSLYLTSLSFVVLAGWYGYYALNPPRAVAGFPFAFTYTLPPPELPVLPLAGAYGLWWATGMASGPYNRFRGIRAFLGFGLLYATAWAVVTQVLFPVETLEALL